MTPTRAERGALASRAIRESGQRPPSGESQMTRRSRYSWAGRSSLAELGPDHRHRAFDNENVRGQGEDLVRGLSSFLLHPFDRVQAGDGLFTRGPQVGDVVQEECLPSRTQSHPIVPARCRVAMRSSAMPGWAP